MRARPCEVATRNVTQNVTAARIEPGDRRIVHRGPDPELAINFEAAAKVQAYLVRYSVTEFIASLQNFRILDVLRGIRASYQIQSSVMNLFASTTA